MGICLLIFSIKLPGNGANRPFIDLSQESCGREICINKGVQNFDW